MRKILGLAYVGLGLAARRCKTGVRQAYSCWYKDQFSGWYEFGLVQGRFRIDIIFDFDKETKGWYKPAPGPTPKCQTIPRKEIILNCMVLLRAAGDLVSMVTSRSLSRSQVIMTHFGGPRPLAIYYLLTLMPHEVVSTYGMVGIGVRQGVWPQMYASFGPHGSA